MKKIGKRTIGTITVKNGDKGNRIAAPNSNLLVHCVYAHNVTAYTVLQNA